MNKPIVLSIEDDGELYRLLTFALKPLPIALYNARTGLEGVAMAKRLRPELLLLDINLPDLHGWEVLRELKEKEGIVVQDVIVLTTHTDARHRVMGHFQDVTAYITKPFNPRELVALVAKTLDVPYAHKSAA